MNIVYTVDNKFVPQLATGICSICENNKEEDVCFYVVSKGITDDNKDALTRYVEKYGKKICIIELSNVKDYIDFDFDTSSWNDIVLARLFFDRLLPNDVDKIIYLDGDTMVRGSLHDLWSIDLSNYVIGAAVEPTANSERKKAISLELTKPYYNAGVLLINMEKWKEMNAGKIVLNFYKEHQGRLFANDQCAINGALKDYILQIPISYNFCNSYRFYNYKALVKMMKPTKFISKEDYQVQCNNPIIIHFLGEERPWRVGNKHTYTNEYMFYWSTLKICKGNDIPVISLVHNLGIGGAVQTGYKYAYEYNYDIAIQYDGDGQHNIEYAKNIIDPIINEKSDFVIGSRFVTENASEFKSSAARRIGIKIISSTIHLITKKRIYDVTSGFRAANKKIIKMFAQDYPVEYPEPLTNMDLILKGYNVKEVPVAMREREGGVSSIRAWKNAYYMINVILSLLVFGLRGKRKNG